MLVQFTEPSCRLPCPPFVGHSFYAERRCLIDSQDFDHPSFFLSRWSKRRKGFPSEAKVKRGVRIVHGDKELVEKVGRNDLCPCCSGRRFKKCCRNSSCFRGCEPGPLLLESDEVACSISMVGQAFDVQAHRRERHLRSRMKREGCSDGDEHSQDRKESTPENCHQGQTLPLRQMPQTKSEACENACSLVLP